MLEKTTCPLCTSDKYILHKKYEVSDLSRRWQNGLGFNPFLNKNIGDVITKLQCIECQLIYYTPVFLGDAGFYATLSKNAWYYEEEKWEFTEALNVILNNKPKSLLEVGCGNGNFLRKVNKALDTVEGIEINEKAIEYCLSNNLKVSSKSLAEIQKQFDAVAMFEVLEHLDNLDAILNNLVRITNKGGIIIIAVPNPNSYLKDLDVVLLDMPPHHTAGWSSTTFDYVAKKYNLEKTHYAQEPLRDVHYQGIARTKFFPINSPEDLKSNSFKNKIKRFIINILDSSFRPIINRLDYLTYKFEQPNSVGQTHLVVFKKL